MKKFLGLVIAVAFLTGCSVVSPGTVGVRVTLGTVSEDVKPSGVYLWIPFVIGMKKLDVQIQKSEVQTSAASKDMQELTTDLAVNWSIDASQAVATYKTIGDEDDVLKRIITPAVSETLKQATSNMTADEILKKRTELKTILDSSLRERLTKYGVLLHDVSIVNFRFSDQFTQAIENKQVSEQRAKQAEYETQKAEQDAKAAIAKAKGEAEANRLKQQSLTPQLIQYEMIQKWNGVLSSVVAGGNSSLMIQLPNNK